MPTKTDLLNLLSTDYTDGGTWVTSYNGVSVNGLLVKGKTGTAYASNEVFFPAAGSSVYGNVYAGDDGYYWSSTPYDADGAGSLNFFSGVQYVNYGYRESGYSVRAVLAE